MRSCARCGRPDMQVNLSSRTPGVCKDCRGADPWWVKQATAALVADAEVMREISRLSRETAITPGDSRHSHSPEYRRARAREKALGRGRVAT